MNSEETPQPLFPNWMRGFLLITTVYNVAWGAFITWFPQSFFEWVTQSEEATPGIIVWQGRVVLLMAIAYFMSALYPRKFWYLIGIGILTKLVGGLWFYFSILEQEVGKTGWFHLIMNDLVWLFPLSFIFYKAYSIRNLIS